MAGFVIPNKADVGSDNSQSQLDATDFRTIVAGFDAIGVVADVGGECAVTATGTPDQNVQIAVGEISTQDSHFTVAAGALAMPAAHATLNRYDLVVIDAAGLKQARSGPEAVSPVFPVPTAGDVVLAAVWRPAADNTIAAGDITDKRIIRRHRASSPLGGQYVIQFPTVTNGAGGEGPPAWGLVVKTPTGRDLLALRALEGGVAGERSLALWMAPPVDGGRARMDWYLTLDPAVIAAGGASLFFLQSHGMAEGNHTAPGEQHATIYGSGCDSWTLRTTVSSGAISAGAPGDSITPTFTSMTNIDVGDVLLVWDVASNPTTYATAPDADWEYMKVTSITPLTLTRGWWGTRAPAHPASAQVFEVTRVVSNQKMMQWNFGPSSDSRTANRLRIQFPTAELDLCQNKLYLNGSSAVRGAGNCWFEWDNANRRLVLTGVTDGATLLLYRAASTDMLMFGAVFGEGFSRAEWRADGRIGWGSGSLASNTFLERIADFTLGLDSKLRLMNFTRTYITTPQTFLTTDVANVITMNVGSGVTSFVKHDAIIEFQQAGAAAGSAFLFWSNGVLRNRAANAVGIGGYIMLVDQMLMRADSQVSSVFARSLFSSPIFEGISGGALTVGHFHSVHAAGVVNAGATITMRKALMVDDITGAGALTDQVIIDIPVLSKASGLNLGIRCAARVVFTPPAAQSITGVGVAFLPTSPIHEFTSTGNYTLTVAPTIADGQDGQILTLVNVGSNTVTIQDQGTLASSNLRLSATTIALGPRDSIELYYSADVGDWLQKGPLVSVL